MKLIILLVLAKCWIINVFFGKPSELNKYASTCHDWLKVMPRNRKINSVFPLHVLFVFVFYFFFCGDFLLNEKKGKISIISSVIDMPMSFTRTEVSVLSQSFFYCHLKSRVIDKSFFHYGVVADCTNVFYLKDYCADKAVFCRRVSSLFLFCCVLLFFMPNTV